MNAEPAASEPHQAFADPFLSYVNSTTMLGIAARLSGTFLLYIAHGIDSTGFGIVGERSGHELGVNAMRHYNSVFHQLLKHLPWEEFDALVKEHRADARVRRLTTISKSISKQTCGRIGKMTCRSAIA